MGFTDKITEISLPKSKGSRILVLAFATILSLYGIYSVFSSIRENRVNRIAEKFIQDNQYIGNSFIYDYEIRHNATKPSVISISIAGEPLSQESINNLHSKLAEAGLAPEQLAINQNNTSLAGKTPDNEFLEGIFKQNEQEILKREQLIAGMQSQLKAFKQKELPTMQIAKEISAQYPQMLSLTLARGEMVDAMLIGTENPNQLSEKVIAIIKFSEPISDAETGRLQKWLAIRLDVPSIRIIVEQ